MTRLRCAALIAPVFALVLAALPVGAQPERGYEKRQRPDGLTEYRYDRGHKPQTTHGVDAPVDGTAAGDCIVDALGLRICVNPPSDTPPPSKPATCATGYRFVAIHAHPGDPNPNARAEIVQQIEEMNAFVDSEAAENGSGASMRFACDSDGKPTAHVVRVTSCKTWGDVTNSLSNQGYNQSDEKYVVYCGPAGRGGGQASIHNDSRDTVSNANNSGPSFAVMYDNDGRDFDAWVATGIPLHEVGHTMGAVQLDAPDSSGAWHCDGRGSEDTMCYDDGGSKWDDAHACGTVERKHFDACHNDYFHPAPPSSSYLAGHWNLASCHLDGRWLELSHC